jgi:hypothetical protein
MGTLLRNHDSQCEDGLTGLLGGDVVLCMCMDRATVTYPELGATPRNLCGLIVIEDGKRVHATIHSTMDAARAAWREFVIEAAGPNTALDEELRDAAHLDVQENGWTIERVVADLSDFDLIEWWVNRPATFPNEVHFFEAQDKTTP